MDIGVTLLLFPIFFAATMLRAYDVHKRIAPVTSGFCFVASIIMARFMGTENFALVSLFTFGIIWILNSVSFIEANEYKKKMQKQKA